jgi:hypothetical protein
MTIGFCPVICQGLSTVAHRIPLGNQISHLGLAHGVARRAEMDMRVGGTIIFSAIFRFLIRKSFVKIPGLSYVDRFPFTCLSLPGKNDIAGYFSKTRFYRMNPISIIPTGLTRPVNVRLAHISSPF